jgi:hypothetical protein
MDFRKSTKVTVDTSPKGEVVVLLWNPDAHIALTPQEARDLASVLRMMAASAEKERYMPAKPIVRNDPNNPMSEDDYRDGWR